MILYLHVNEKRFLMVLTYMQKARRTIPGRLFFFFIFVCNLRQLLYLLKNHSIECFFIDFFEGVIRFNSGFYFLDHLSDFGFAMVIRM